jgi:hypothetical protein
METPCVDESGRRADFFQKDFQGLIDGFEWRMGFKMLRYVLDNPPFRASLLHFRIAVRPFGPWM